jgi:hypothetical protein
MIKDKIIHNMLVWEIILTLLLPALVSADDGFVPAFPIERDEMTLDRLAQPNTYFDKAGRRFAILGFESGTFEAWAYPLKLVRKFEFSFLLKNSTRPIPGREIVRFVEVSPAATVLTYTHQSFTVKAIFVTAVSDPGAVILLDVDATEPLTVVAGFLPVLQPMWPAGIGGQYATWDGNLKAYLISEPTRTNHGFVGSPAAQGISYTPAHMLSDTPNEFTIAVEKPEEARSKFIPIILAGGKGKREDIRKAYEKLARDPSAVYSEAKGYYRDLRKNTLRLKTPVRKLDLALEWTKVSYDNLRVDNSDLGRGLVAGLGVSGTGGRPGFGWFFGTDAYLNSLSLSSLGALEGARETLAFTQKWQREDGKMAHELSQAAGFINWFVDYPYGYIHADTTPFYIIAMYDYYLRSGDGDFIRMSWPSLVRAYEWCLTTDGDSDGLMDNSKAGLGALEFGALTRIQTDIYLASVWIRAAFSLEKLARALGETRFARRAATDCEKALASFEARFWDEKKGNYAYAFNAEGQQVKELTAWCAVPLVWKIGSPERAAKTLEKICSSELTTDWGVRILTNRSSLYEPLNYNYGAVWPFLTGYAAVALYKNNHSLQGFHLLMSNVEHVFDNALGQVTELYSGALHVWPQEAVAHQGFSAGGVVLPLVRGLLGLDGDASARQVVFEPRFPADWPKVLVENFRLGKESFNFDYRRKGGSIRLEVESRPENSFTLNFSPALGAGTRVSRASVNGQPVECNLLLSEHFFAQAAQIQVRPFKLSGHDIIELEFEPTVEILPSFIKSAVGDNDSGLKIIRIDSEGKMLRAVIEGLAGHDYVLRITRSDLVAEVAGARLDEDRLLIRIPNDEEAPHFLRHEVIIKLKP